MGIAIELGTVVAIVVAVVAWLGSIGLTVWMVNERCDRRLEAASGQLRQEIKDLEARREASSVRVHGRVDELQRDVLAMREDTVRRDDHHRELAEIKEELRGLREDLQRFLRSLAADRRAPAGP